MKKLIEIEVHADLTLLIIDLMSIRIQAHMYIREIKNITDRN